MRHPPSSRLGVATAGLIVATGAGCTFLISFEDAPRTDAEVVPAEASVQQPPVPDTGTFEPPPDSGDASPPAPVMPACDTTFPLAQVKGCEGFIEGGQICADNPGLTTYPGDRTRDVVTCSKTQGATCVRHCIACAHLPEGFPDQCDLCTGKKGKYCGTDMGWQPENFRLLVTCEGDRIANTTPCSTKGCDSKGGTGDAACKP